MANVKSRVKSSESKSTKSGRGAPQNSDSNVNNDIEPITVMKRPSNLNPLTAEEKVQYLLKNGHLIKDMFLPKAPMKNGKLDKSSLPISRNNLMSSTGKIRKKRMRNLYLIDNILQSEFNMVKENDKNVKQTKTVKSKHKSKPGTNNNNDVDTTDHNINKNHSKQDKNKQPTLEDLGEIMPQTVNHKQTPPSELERKVGVPRRKGSFECDYCGRKFCTKSSLRRHIYSHLNILPRKCPYCTKIFRHADNMDEHVLAKHSDSLNKDPNYTCEICAQQFFLEESYFMHLSTHMQYDGSYKCLFCDNTYNQFILVIQHERQHLVNGRYQCTICNSNYHCRDQLSFHLKNHLKIKEFMCQYCGKEFLRFNSMQRHVQVCHGGHRIQCTICKKYLKGHLSEHMRTHEKRRPHKCPDCGQRFTQSTQLNVHRRSHTGARPYPCRICEQYFSHSNALMLHIRRHTGEKPFPCAMCPTRFSQLPHMKAHMKNIHGKDNAYKCNKCEQFFKLKAELDKHSKNCTVGDKVLSLEEQIEASVKSDDVEVESVMSLSRMRYLLALLLTMIATKDKMKFLGFNKRLIDDILIDSLEAMGITAGKDDKMPPINILKSNIQLLLDGTVPKEQMEKFKSEKKSTEEILELLTDEKKPE